VLTGLDFSPTASPER
ncbi:hypothetical protein VN97_g7423, partial [Penicillium thymicola]